MNSGAVRKLWFGFAVVATYLSVYPGDFQMPFFPSSSLRIFLESCCGRPGRGDVLGNFILFVPFGFLGMLAARRGGSNVSRAVYVCILAVVFALVLQFAQIFLPSRDENLQDVFWNFLGTLAGIPIGATVRQYVSPSSRVSGAIVLVPWLLISAWLTYRLIPFVPSIDLQGIKDSLKPLLLHPQLIPANIFHDAVAWLLIAFFLRDGHRSVRLDGYLLPLMVATFGLEVLIVANTVSASNVIGAGLAVAVWWGLLRPVSRPERVLAVMLFAMLVFAGLAPFSFERVAVAFNWLPFKGYLGGSMYINAQSACEKTFLYGSLVYLLWRSGLARWQGATIAAVGVLMIEFAQTRFSGHTPEITDPIVVVLMALAIAALQDDKPGLRRRRSKSHLRRRSVTRS